MTSRDVRSYSYNLIILSLNYFSRSCRLKRRWSRTWWATQSTTSSTSRRCKTPSDSWVADFHVFSFFAVLVFPLISTRWVRSTIKHLYCRLSLSSAAVDKSQKHQIHLGMLRIEPRTAGREAQTLPLCYAPSFFHVCFCFVFDPKLCILSLFCPKLHS